MRVFLYCLLGMPALLGQSYSLADPAKPALLKATLLTGSLKVVGHGGREVVVEGLSAASEKYPGMKRIHGPVEVQGNTVVLRSDPQHPVSGTILVKVPYGATVEAKCLANGELTVEGVRGPVTVEHLNGNIHITGASGAVAATSLNGNLRVDLSEISAPITLATLNGHIDLAISAQARADVTVHVPARNRFRSEVPFQEGPSGREREHGPQALRGTFNGGGQKVSLRCLNGDVVVRKR